ncbi:MAG: MarR family transcriptional regulator, partial [Aestuariibacter sp.]|nr:MarR family transcriptional regulator [Aestuariibacter sp.]
MSADDWATIKTCGTVQSQQALRAEIAADMQAWEAEHGAVKTSPITTYDKGLKRLRRAMGDNLSVKRDSKGNLNTVKLTLLQRKVLLALKKGHHTTPQISKYCKTATSNIKYTLSRLVVNGYIERVS